MVKADQIRRSSPALAAGFLSLLKTALTRPHPTQKLQVLGAVPGSPSPTPISVACLLPLPPPNSTSIMAPVGATAWQKGGSALLYGSASLSIMVINKVCTYLRARIDAGRAARSG